MIKWIGIVLGAGLALCLVSAAWFAVQGVQVTRNFLRTGTFVMFSETEPVKIVNISCQNCSQSTTRNRFTSKAVGLEARYKVEEPGTLYLRFASGTAQVDGKTLHPGCHEIALEAADQFEVSAKQVEIAFPQSLSQCLAPTETS